MVVVTRSGRTLYNDIMNLKEDPNKRRFDEKESEKRKKLDKFNEKVTMPKDPNPKKSRKVEEKIRNEEEPKVVDGHVPKLDKSFVTSKPQIKVSPPLS